MTTTIDKLETLRDQARQHYERMQDARKLAEEAETAALDNWSRARIEYSRAVGHPLAGKNVTRITPSYRDPRKTLTWRGIVTLYEGLRTDYSMPGHRPIPGEWYIASLTGKTGYCIPIGGIERNGWKVDE